MWWWCEVWYWNYDECKNDEVKWDEWNDEWMCDDDSDSIGLYEWEWEWMRMFDTETKCVCNNNN